jgi:nitrite reductase/ring-hydroxylating ferredoxin subunit
MSVKALPHMWGREIRTNNRQLSQMCTAPGLQVWKALSEPICRETATLACPVHIACFSVEGG